MKTLEKIKKRGRYLFRKSTGEMVAACLDFESGLMCFAL